jgi:hypothetical protein
MARAVGTDVLADIRRDNRHSVHEPSSPVRVAPTGAPKPSGGTGWVDALPLKPPSGNRWVDPQLDAQDTLDRTERARERGPKP